MKSNYTLALLLLTSQTLFLTCQAGSCAGMTADGLLPSEYGDQTRDCCPTYDTECAGITGSGEDDCYCDTNCATFGDCCDDHATTCAWIFWDNATDIASDTTYVSESNVDFLVFTTSCDQYDYISASGSHCGNGGLCGEDDSGTVWCDCPAEFSGDQCELKIDDCVNVDTIRTIAGNDAPIPCGENAVCQDQTRIAFGQSNFNCSCAENYQETAPFNFWKPEEYSCVEIPCILTNNCENDSACSINPENEFDYLCACGPHFTGKNCDEVIDDCENDPCDPNASCTNEVRTVHGEPAYSCECNTGYRGNDKTQNELICRDIPCEVINPCQNNGSCFEDTGEIANCICSPEFFHTNENMPYCQESFDDCPIDSVTKLNPCGMGGSSCTDLERTVFGEVRYQCSCKDGFHVGSGSEHLKIYVDDSKENGVCVETPCELDALNPCENDSECFVNTVYNIAECNCKPEHVHDTSIAHTCIGEGCSSVEGYTNNYCQLAIDDCEFGLPCGSAEAGTCTDEVRSEFGEAAYSCTCKTGYVLDSDSGQCVDKNECDSSPCVNTDICHNLFNDFACGTSTDDGYSCNTGWQGKQCDEEKDWCNPDPCDSTGSEFGGCTSTTEGFTCACRFTEYEGTIYKYRGVTCENPPQVVSNIPSEYSMGLGIDQATYDEKMDTTLNFETVTITAMDTAFDGSPNYGGVVNYEQLYDQFTGELTIKFELIFKISVADLFATRRSLELKVEPLYPNSSFILNPDFQISARSGRRITLDASQISFVNNAVSSTADSAASASSNSGTPATKRSSGSDAANVELQGDVDACLNNPCQNLGRCTDKDGVDDTPVGRTCTCQPDYLGDSCETQINDCEPNNCQNVFNCKDGILDYFCDCTMSFIWSGKNCDHDNFCGQSDPCTGTNGQCNGGKCNCLGGVDYGWNGANCAIKDYCLTWELDNGAIVGTQAAICPANSVCISQSDSKLCQCLPGFGPPGDCSGSACDGMCFNNGICEMPGGIASCECQPGFSGDRCQNSVCDGNNCSEQGTCGVDSSGNAVCTCIPPYAAFDCSLVCNDRGVLNADRLSCTCDSGYVGNECGELQKVCAVNGVWQSDNSCLCGDEFTGELCGEAKVLCGVHGIWLLPNNCTCDDPVVWFGLTCEDNACTGIDCSSRGTCHILPTGGMYCECRDKWTGLICGTAPPKVCSNNGIKFIDECVCNQDFGGYDCQVPALDCLNGGKFNQKTTYCDCTTGWFGDTCDTKDVGFRLDFGVESSSLKKGFSLGIVVVPIIVVLIALSSI